MMPTWTRTAKAAPGATPREGRGRRSPGSGGRALEGAFTMPGVYPETNVGAPHAAPLPIPRPHGRAYFLACSGGVKPITWTPAPCAMSIACITSTYLRVGAALMNSSLAGRGS